MLIRVIAVAAVAVLALAPQALAMGGGKKDGGGSVVSGNFSSLGAQSGTFSLSCSGSNCSGSFQGNGGSGRVTGSVMVATPEPLAALAAGLGLLGARLLRRRR